MPEVASTPVSQKQFSHMSQKVNKMGEDLHNLALDTNRSYGKALSTLAKHSVIHLITGGAITLIVPIFSFWVFNYAQHMDTLTRSVITLEERYRFYDRSPSTQAGKLGVGNYWKVTAQSGGYCLVDRTSLAEQPSEHFLYSDGTVPSSLELQPIL